MGVGIRTSSGSSASTSHRRGSTSPELLQGLHGLADDLLARGGLALLVPSPADVGGPASEDAARLQLVLAGGGRRRGDLGERVQDGLGGPDVGVGEDAQLAAAGG